MYIGETGRNLKERLEEHQYAVKKNNMKNGITAHACQQQHTVDWSAAKVRCTEQQYWKRKVLEAIHVHQQTNTSNLDCGLKISPVWLPLISLNEILHHSFLLYFMIYSPFHVLITLVERSVLMSCFFVLR